MLRKILTLHLESTDVCQAACPACARETDPEFDASKKHHLTVDMIQKVLPESQLKTLQKMFMCGNYGDPAAGKHTMDIYRYFRDINPNIVLGMNTNGAIQHRRWWRTLGKFFSRNPQDYVVFSIDGLEDTNHLYRQGVEWGKLMENVRAYISTGASAHWDMLVYRHNEHQVDACERMARDLGFSWFRAKVSKRDLCDDLEFPINWTVPRSPNTKVVKCHALREKSLYIDAQGRQSPCCWLGSRQQNFITDIGEVMGSWYTDQANPVCIETCAVDESVTAFTSQWQREVHLC